MRLQGPHPSPAARIIRIWSSVRGKKKKCAHIGHVSHKSGEDLGNYPGADSATRRPITPSRWGRLDMWAVTQSLGIGITCQFGHMLIGLGSDFD